MEARELLPICDSFKNLLRFLARYLFQFLPSRSGRRSDQPLRSPAVEGGSLLLLGK